MNSFLRSCWLSCLATTFAIFGLTALAWHGTVSKLPAQPDITLFGKNYISFYGTVGGTVHYIYRLGLFGMKDRLQQSDILLLGSSHVEFGLSADELSQRLSQATGRKITAYNAGIGWAEGLGFAKVILENNQVKKKAIVMDLLSIGGADRLSVYGQSMSKSESLRAYCYVLDVWVKASSDYCLDSLIPRLKITDFTHYDFSRALFTTQIRNWATGDIVQQWYPLSGDVYVQASTPITAPYPDAFNRGIFFDAGTRQLFSQCQLNPLYTIVPFGDSQLATIPPDAHPFVPLSAVGISYWDDQQHLTSASRKIVTDRLADGIIAQHLLDTWPEPPSK